MLRAMTPSFVLVIKLLLLCQAITTLRTMEILSTCCQSVNIDEPCRSLCESPTLKSAPPSVNFTESCPEIQQCVELMSKNRHWQGRSCCASAVMKRCADGCQISSSSKMLSEHCRRSDEFALYSCIATLERKSGCCSYAKTYGCMQVCQQMMFNKSINVNSLEEELHASCRDNNEDVVNCVYDNVNIVSPHQQERFKTCCGLTHSKACAEGCRSILGGGELTDNHIELLEQKCGSVNLNVEIWKCFLANESKNDNSNVMPIGDLAKLNCCVERAKSVRCKKICINVYTYADMNSLDVFYKECLANFTEIELSQCIEEIESPVQLGCDSVSFCTNFNHRPRELFRSCNRFSDLAARHEYTQWVKKSSLQLFGEDILINHSEACLALLHAFACSLHLKPASRALHYSQICHEDCVDIISSCNHNIEIKICSKLPKGVPPCISLRDFLHANEENENEVSMPCREHQCNTTTEKCEVDRVTNKYQCSKGACQVGQGSSLIVPSGTFVRIPFKTEQGCFQVCKCQDGNLKKCTKLPCVKLSTCTIGNQTIPHGSSMEIECNVCGCFAGEITCTKKQCRLLSDVQTSSFMSLPCNCPPHYTPVCGSNGKTYPSSCIAKCAGLNDADFVFGACESIDTCAKNGIKCRGGFKCVQNKQVCLSSPKIACSQYKCSKYELEITEPTFDHRVCNNVDVVCGINGMTYRSECECIKDFSMVDYDGNCRAVGLIDAKEACAGIKCPRLPEKCEGATIPTGACCAVCGGVLKVVYSRKQVDREVYAVKTDVTIKTVMELLQKLVTVPTCYLAGYLTIESDLMIIVYSVVKHPTVTQIDVCRDEAIKIANLANTKSHHFTVNLGLSSFIVANYIEPTLSSAPAMLNYSITILIVFYSIILQIFVWK